MRQLKLALIILLTTSTSCTDQKSAVQKEEKKSDIQTNFDPIPFIQQNGTKHFDLDGIYFDSDRDWKASMSTGPDFTIYSIVQSRKVRFNLYFGNHPKGPDFYKASVQRDRLTNEKVAEAFEKNEVFQTRSDGFEIEVKQDSIHTYWIQTSQEPQTFSEILIYRTDAPRSRSEKIHLMTQLNEEFTKKEFMQIAKSIEW